MVSTYPVSELHGNAKDISGRDFARLTPVRPVRSEGSKAGVMWLCECECGNEKVVRANHLLQGSIESCGCLYGDDIRGEKFGRLTAIHPTEGRSSRSVVWVCECECGDMTEVRVSSLTSGNTTSCGKGGPCSPNWQGGKTPKNRLARNDPRLDEWRTKVFERDGYQCRSCGEQGGELHPHHILNFSQHPSYRFDVNNGVTLCKQCHIEFHKEYGQECNDYLGIIDFIGGMV